MPDEVNIDDLIDLPKDEERVHKLQVMKLYRKVLWLMIVSTCDNYQVNNWIYHIIPIILIMTF